MYAGGYCGRKQNEEWNLAKHCTQIFKDTLHLISTNFWSMFQAAPPPNFGNKLDELKYSLSFVIVEGASRGPSLWLNKFYPRNWKREWNEENSLHWLPFLDVAKCFFHIKVERGSLFSLSFFRGALYSPHHFSGHEAMYGCTHHHCSRDDKKTWCQLSGHMTLNFFENVSFLQLLESVCCFLVWALYQVYILLFVPEVWRNFEFTSAQSIQALLMIIMAVQWLPDRIIKKFSLHTPCITEAEQNPLFMD